MATDTSTLATFFTEYGEAQRYSIKEVIGKGSYGVVCSAIDNTTGRWRGAVRAVSLPPSADAPHCPTPAQATGWLSRRSTMCLSTSRCGAVLCCLAALGVVL